MAKITRLFIGSPLTCIAHFVLNARQQLRPFIGLNKIIEYLEMFSVDVAEGAAVAAISVSAKPAPYHCRVNSLSIHRYRIIIVSCI